MKVFVIGDAHFKFHNQKALNKIYKLIEQEQPHAVVQVGDLYDFYLFSKYSKSIKVDPVKEIKDSRKMAEKMWAKIKSIVPKAKCYQLLGNHDMRLAKRIQEKMPELELVFDYRSLFQFDGVKTMESDRDFLELDGVVYVHGWLSKSIDHARYFNKPCVHGHRHRPTVEIDGRLWSMDVGFIADASSLPLSYTMSTHSRWRMGCGQVEDGSPRLFLL